MRKTSSFKFIIICIMMASLLLLTVGCGRSGSKPEQVIDDFAGHLQQLRFEQAAALLQNPETLYLTGNAGQNLEGTKALLSLACENLTYDIVSVDTEGDLASAEVTVTVPDVSSLLMEFLRDSLMMTLIESKNQDLRTDLQSLLADKVTAFSAAESYSMRTSTVTLYLERVDGTWWISDPGLFEVALIGGFEQIFSIESE